MKFERPPADLDRRELLKGALLAAATGGLSYAAETSSRAAGPAAASDVPWEIIDANVSLFQWPFRRLPYDTVDELVAKLRSLNVGQAWAGSFEGILHRDVSGVNDRLAEACRKVPNGFLVPFGTVNPELPGWEEDLRACHEEHGMPGIRVHPNYHGYALDDPRFERLLAMAAERDLLVQLAASMEDVRTQHPMLQVPDVDLSPISELMRKIPRARVLLLNHKTRGALLTRLAETPRVYFDIARVEGTEGVAQLIRSVPPGRVVFGTHAPFFITESALIKVYESGVTADECRALLEQNPRQLVPSRMAG